ncbi:M42 family metallopeptidase [candidate division WOR-3 bacterium]|nr:M42 family metallopeptidase [candidate division WOR-3 bacterium]
MYLEKLSNLCGVAGYEHAVRKFIKDTISEHVDSVQTDSLGNLICIKKAKEKGPKILLTAHMDEIGFIVESISKDGFVHFTPSGGVDPRILPAKRVLIGDKSVPGIICWPPPHLVKKPGASIPEVSALIIDIGAESDKAAQKKIAVGDFITFDTVFGHLSKDRVKGKAFDDRMGCSLLMEMLKNKEGFPFDLYGVFTVQEEVGLRGAGVLGERINPKAALVLEGTGAADFPQEDEDLDLPSYPCLGKGVVVTLSDNSILVSRKLIDLIEKVAKEKKIKYQFKQPQIGGTDAGRIHISRKGIPCAIFSVPSRYIHSPVSIASLSDYRETLKLAEAFLPVLVKSFS